ncbi:XRE family transcriptional regulator [Sporosarcina newyorkensis 2681]|uniref:XRE family transcriptional regulator n=1 Tax=Sporosarcina newyorkensis 2681 TaxID=1027292 RepID=F9DY64_9BACL|nr:MULTISPECIES: helix-turn-helix transcriptional regulator [Sporosarcina]EGQ19218.1 XRE family transcriptional regulator [Sporosarcina newyorkensis 2681]PIC57056.1 XRE family transcriptional regulator [Sporosarcina sp. P10]PIC60439.1 XRE family transcriptional regulator [Sporosarcina sp. P12(2017)]
MSLGFRLKKEREKRSWSQVEVANKVGITNAVLSNYERDYRDPDTETLKKLADLYDVSTDFLLGRTENSALINKDEEEFQKAISDPDLKRWYSELPNSNEEDLQKLRKMWEIIKNKDK